MKTSENTKDLFSKLFTALIEMPVIEKDRGGSNGIRYKYMDLDTLINKVKPILQTHDLAFTQSVGNVDGKQSLTTRIFHKSGEWIEDTTVLPHAKLSGGCNEAQELGSSITYMRRYSLCAMLGIVSDDDTDGLPTKQEQPKQEPPKVNEALEAKIKELESYYSIISPEAKSQCEDAVRLKNESRIDTFLKKAKEKKAELEAPKKEPDEYVLEIEQLIESTISGKPMFTDDEKKKIYARLESEWSKKVLEDVKVIVGNRAEGKGDQLDIF